MERGEKEKQHPLISTLRKAVFRHGYLIITAAWLYTLSFLVTNYWSYNASPKKVQSKVQQHLKEYENRFATILSDSLLVHSLINENDSSDAKQNLSNEGFGLFTYTYNDRGNMLPVYWNSNRYYIEPEDLLRNDGSYFVNYQNGDFELIKTTLHFKEQKLLVIAVIPVEWKFFIDNSYLHPYFDGHLAIADQYEISSDTNALPIYNAKGDELFKIHLKDGKAFTHYDAATILLRVIAIILLLFFINSLTSEIIAEQGFRKGAVFLFSIVIILRLLAYTSSFPFIFSKLPLFDPSIYASNFLHPSLGDLLINAVLFFWLTSFLRTHLITQKNIPKETKHQFGGIVGLVVLVLLAFLIANIIRSLVLDSKISFDVSNFFTLNVYSVISFAILCMIVLSFFLLSHVLLALADRVELGIYARLLITSVTGLIILSINIDSPFIASNIAVLCWLLGYLVLMGIRKKDMHKPLLRSSFFIFWVLFFAISVASLVMYQNRVTELEQRKKFAERLSTQTDPYGETLLSIATTNFNDSILTQNFHRLQHEAGNKEIKDSLINENFVGYLNKYDTRIYTFDSLFHPLFNDDSTNYAIIRTIIINQGKQTTIPGLYSYDNANEKPSYLYEKVIHKDSSTLGYLFVIVKPKRYKSDALYPELFRQVQDLYSDLNVNYAYAVYHNGKLAVHFNEYGFASQLSKNYAQQPEFNEINKNGSSELWYNAGSDKQIVIVKKSTSILEYITLFAYLFCSFLIIIFSFQAGSFLLRNRFRLSEIKKFFQFNIRTQIRATIIFISVFSFIIIGISTISFFILRFNQSNEDRLSRTIQVMAGELEDNMKLIRSQSISDNTLTMNDVGHDNTIDKKINEMAEVHNVDVNFYNAEGDLEASTQPYIYNKHLLSEKMNPKAFYDLHINKSIRVIQSEKIGNFNYLSIYIPLSDESGNTYAYLNIPYLNSRAELNQEISGFLATLINLNAFIFLLAGIIAFFVTNRITASFSLIGKKMQAVTLGKVNEAIEWNKNDEIGMLVNEYNKMVQKLEESAKALAQTEREGAWQEMARQVAHEIKNPLTPMKLSIQYLQKALSDNSPNAKQLSQQVAATLIEQIDQLSQIAGDFSQFANISTLHTERFDISEAIAPQIYLHKTNTNIHINWIKEEGNHFVIADKVQMGRLFTNLIKNAIEASEEKDEVYIDITEKDIDDKVQISIADRGTGIPKEMQAKIFAPNFTTKTSGTGLGLAICKGIVENANGTIWFETIENEGTTFFVELPLAKGE